MIKVYNKVCPDCKIEYKTPQRCKRYCEKCAKKRIISNKARYFQQYKKNIISNNNAEIEKECEQCHTLYKTKQYRKKICIDCKTKNVLEKKREYNRNKSRTQSPVSRDTT